MHYWNKAARRTLKEGDLVEVDATKGIVRVLKRACPIRVLARKQRNVYMPRNLRVISGTVFVPLLS